MAITIPNTFVAGTKIEAAPVNANFAETANAVDKRGDTLTGNLSANAGITVDGVDLSTIPNIAGTFNPLFPQVVIGTADTNGIRLDLESGTLAVREGDDSAYGPLTSGLLTTSGNHVPATNDGGALGTTSLSWADLFLASGGVINFNNGDVTLTHSTNTLTFAGATNGYTFDRQIKAASSQVEVGGFFDMYAGAGYDIIGFTDGTGLVVGGYRAAQWATVRLYASGAERFRVTGNNIAILATGRIYLDGVAGSGDTYLEEVTANEVRIVAAGNERLRAVGSDGIKITGALTVASGTPMYFDGSFSGDTYAFESSANVFELIVGGTSKIRAAQTGISVSTSATTIIANAGGLGSFVVVNGNDGSNRFCDLVLASTATAPTVVSSYTSLGSPAARTYTRSSDALQLAMASGTYSVHTVKLGS